MITEIGVKYLVRRAVIHGGSSEGRRVIQAKDFFTREALPFWFLVLTVIVALVVLLYLSLGSNVILTLTALESDSNGYERVPRDEEESDEAKESLLEGKGEEEVPPPPYEEEPATRITTSLRRTFRLLRAEDGLLRFPIRGIRALFWYKIFVMLLSNFLGLPLSTMFKVDAFEEDDVNNFTLTSYAGIVIGKGIAKMFLANMFVVVTHAQIASAATNNSYGISFKRVLKAPWKSATPTLLPLGIIVFTASYTEILVHNYFKQVVVTSAWNTGMPELSGCNVAALLVLLVLSTLSGMAMLRMHASSFPREDKTIVPINFGFGMIPESKEVKVLSFCQALRSYSFQDIVNIIVMFVKLSAISYFVQMFFFGLIYAQAITIMFAGWRF